MAELNEHGFWLNARGKATPPEYIDPVVKRRDKVVERIVKDALAMEERMKAAKAKMLKLIDDYLAYSEKKSGAPREGKGNLTLTNFIGDKQVEFSLSDVIDFDERLQMAKGIIDKCLHKWSKDAHENIAAIVSEAFSVDKKGSVDKVAILRLRQIKIKDDDWLKAMELITDSITITGTRQYLVVRERKDSSQKFKTVNMNFSSIEV